MNKEISAAPGKQLSLRQYIRQEGVQQRIKEALAERAPRFTTALLQLSSASNLDDCSPPSLLGAAMTSAILDLPIQKDLGYSWIVPYKAKGGLKLAQFQIGWKGLVQLAIRSGQFERLNARPINKEAYAGTDEFGEAKIDWKAIDDSQPAIGYACIFKLVTGFTKTEFMTREQANAHAKKFSKAFASGYDTPWKTDFDAMALKTVVKRALSKWAPMSVQITKGIQFDQAVINEDDTPTYPDGREVGTSGSSGEPKIGPQKDHREKLIETLRFNFDGKSNREIEDELLSRGFIGDTDTLDSLTAESISEILEKLG